MASIDRASAAARAYVNVDIADAELKTELAKLERPFSSPTIEWQKFSFVQQVNGSADWKVTATRKEKIVFPED